MKFKKNVAYRCYSKAEADALLEDIEKNTDWKWIDGSNPTVFHGWWYENQYYKYSTAFDGLVWGDGSLLDDDFYIVDYIPENKRPDFPDVISSLSTELLSKTVFLAEGQFIPRECVIEVLNKYGAEIKEGE